jgi:hypothetical protein
MSAVEARKAMEAFFVAFNARDSEGLQKTMHFPHLRISGQNRISIRMNPVESKMLHDAAFDFLNKREGWDHSSLDMVEVVHESDVKVHFKIEFSRYKADSVKYATHKSLWIVTKEDDHWGILARSSYAF